MPWHDIKIEIIEIQGTGKCHAGHEVGQHFETAEEQRKICSAAYHTLYPYITAIKTGGSFPWEEKEGEVTICCPDHKNPVVFKIQRVVK